LEGLPERQIKYLDFIDIYAALNDNARQYEAHHQASGAVTAAEAGEPPVVPGASGRQAQSDRRAL
jgi:hypothetical protein